VCLVAMDGGRRAMSNAWEPQLLRTKERSSRRGAGSSRGAGRKKGSRQVMVCSCFCGGACAPPVRLLQRESVRAVS
jgi:hypothetical protein